MRPDLEAATLKWLAENDPHYAKHGARALKAVRHDEYRKSRAGSIRYDGSIHHALLNDHDDMLPSPDDIEYTPEKPDIFAKYRDQLSALLPALLPHFKSLASKRAVALIVQTIPFAKIAEKVGLTRRQIYYIRDKMRDLLPTLIKSIALPLFSACGIDLPITRAWRNTSSIKKNRHVTTVTQLALL
ncbi:hypothetical protein [Acidiphilium acidophilum]|uniref:RNA polymerase sigma factor 70 region 4 type 2 domain-containing protein n=1 Tax=Acidiphilium acidophilum TaxID=76588 RepID=A0AAW9DT99_ACIAO|nr:hypothetical protein [Acidiphilium acidophilum]MDX5931759.1 hypothetical protein [Acidiphilium acidophilum]